MIIYNLDELTLYNSSVQDAKWVEGWGVWGGGSVWKRFEHLYAAMQMRLIRCDVMLFILCSLFSSVAFEPSFPFVSLLVCFCWSFGWVPLVCFCRNLCQTIKYSGNREPHPLGGLKNFMTAVRRRRRRWRGRQADSGKGWREACW